MEPIEFGSNEPYSEISMKIYMKCTKPFNIVIYELCLCLVGMVNTSVITLVFTRKHLRNSSMNILIAGLEISNFISMFAILPKYFIWATCPSVVAGTEDSVLAELVLTLYKPSITFANWIMPVIGTWRLVAVTWPIKAHLILTKRLATIIMVIIGFASILLSVYIFLYHLVERSIFTSFHQLSDKCLILPNFNNTVLYFQGLKCHLFDREVFLPLSVSFSVAPCVLSNVVNVFLICGLVAKSVRKRTLMEGQRCPFSIRAEAKTTCVLVMFLLAHGICYVCPDLFTLIAYTCPTCYIEREVFFCFFFYHFPAVIYLSFLALICYCLMSGRFRTTICEIFRLNELCQKLKFKDIARLTSRKRWTNQNNNLIVEETRL